MFVYLRLMALLGLLAVCGASGYAWLTLPEMTPPTLAQFTETNNFSIAQGYLNSVWAVHRDAMLKFIAGEPEQMRGNAEVTKFAEDTTRYFTLLPFARANIYTSNGTLLYSVNGNMAGALPPKPISPDASFVSTHKQGQTAASKLLANNMLITVVPMRLQPGAAPEGTLEIISGLAVPPQALMDYMTLGINVLAGSGAFFLLLLFLSMFITSRRADAILTKQHEANAELLEAVAAAQAENRDKSQFLANVSHELRTPLNAIIGFSDIIKNEVMPLVQDTKYHNYINDIHSSGVHLLSLINDILDYSKAEAGKLELEVSEINATKLVQNSIRLVAPRAESGQVKLLESLPKEPLVLVTDSKKFKQVLLNLLSNAVKFTPPEGEVGVSAWHNVADDTFTFEVRDSGIGIAPKDISRAMAPFGQVDNTLKRKFEGTGLGLPLTKKFVDLLDGRFTIESEVGKGTTITFTLPREIKPREGLVIKQAS